MACAGCGDVDATCRCAITAGDGIEIEGSGDVNDPIVISSTGGGELDPIAVEGEGGGAGIARATWTPVVGPTETIRFVSDLPNNRLYVGSDGGAYYGLATIFPGFSGENALRTDGDGGWWVPRPRAINGEATRNVTLGNPYGAGTWDPSVDMQLTIVNPSPDLRMRFLAIHEHGFTWTADPGGHNIGLWGYREDGWFLGQYLANMAQPGAGLSNTRRWADSNASNSGIAPGGSATLRNNQRIVVPGGGSPVIHWLNHSGAIRYLAVNSMGT